ncbi:MAG TPA: cation diffusion facilitator family transporter [Blastocatellia bacterium]|jgi:cobalt-zinc-cadmium efflux system protein|nr:cation diffusion facilitator family transporter [Blastocatellia bacterium]
MAEGHKHDHRHHSGAHGNRNLLGIVLGLTVVYMLAEAVGGYLTNSLALISDAGHMLTDVAALLLAMLALWFSGRPATTRKTYGYYRMEILAALANGVALIIISILICYEAVSRIKSPEQVHGFQMLLIATGGLVVNGINISLLRSASDENMNMRGAFLHVVGDALGSIGAIIAGLLIWRLGWTISDPIISIAICLMIVFSSWQLIRDAVNVLLEGTPSHINIQSVVRSMEEVPGVQEVHDLHVWTISSGKDALSAHVTATQGASPRSVLGALRDKLSSEFNIGHVTIQVEPTDEVSEVNVKLYQINRRSEPEADATSTRSSRQSATARKGKD